MPGRDPPVRLHRDGAVGIVELARPDLGNGLSVAACDLVLQGLRDFEADGAVRAMLIRAQGRNF